MSLPSILSFTHQRVREVLQEGAVAVDATVGNGHDTLFLAEQVGPAGCVHGFDIQREALESAHHRLTEAGVAKRVILHHAGHQRMEETLPPDVRGRIRAVMFNLGYLPGGDKTIITRPETTLEAIRQSLRLLSPGGLLTVVLYTGHPGGEEEAEAVLHYMKTLDPQRYQVARYTHINRHHAPSLVAVEKK